MKTPEGRVKDSIKEYLDNLKHTTHQLYWETRQAGGVNYRKGIPDLYCIYKGVHYEIEVKKPGGQRTPMQEKFQKILEDCGCVYILADCVEDVKSTIH